MRTLLFTGAAALTLTALPSALNAQQSADEANAQNQPAPTTTTVTTTPAVPARTTVVTTPAQPAPLGGVPSTKNFSIDRLAKP